ncbi:hypothetical protein GN958_ATG10810 [Phytophthora infestans]|uniref:Uncharacterized protein n=1 Tax=Phytophthora infestans TaxID=4787 RepID=A0A8S9UH14_PHYIN|nr:hypothetical protein GN958_ATG10810 [Phytophthora infestans]
MVVVALILIPHVTAMQYSFFQRAQLKRVSAAYFSIPNCASGAVDGNDYSKTEYCASDCMKLMRRLLPDIPDSEFNDNNLGESYGAIVIWCDETSSSSSGSASDARLRYFSEDTSSTGITMSITPICATEDVAILDKINVESEDSKYCKGNVSTNVVTKVALCDVSSS